AEFPAGFMTQYPEGLLVGGDAYQELAAGYPIGKRFKSVEVTRVSDSNPLHLGHLAEADGRWRVYAFADRPAAGEPSQLAEWAEWFASEDSPLRRHTPAGADPDALFETKVIYQQEYTGVNLTSAPDVFRPEVGPFSLTNNGNVFAANPDGDIFDIRDISRDGAVVVVRPDQYVAQVLPLTDREVLKDFFARIYSPARVSA
nr:3-hydroxybenzoate 4-monooxygenase [Actinomycetales bacterium]